MAERRMFAKTIIDSDAFLDMSLSTQALYFHLSMRADDDGFVNNPRKIQRMIGCGNDELKMLIAKKFIIPFESGICVIKHWKIHNYIRNDRYKPTVYKEEMSELSLKDNNSYTLNEGKKTYGIPSGYQVDTNGIPNGYQMETQVRLGKDSIDKNSIDYIDLSFIDDSIDNVKLTQDKYDKLIDKYNKELVDNEILHLDNYISNGKGKKYKDHYKVLNNWCKDKLNKQNISKENKESTTSYHKAFEFD